MTSGQANRHLLIASDRGDISAVREALAEGAAVNARDNHQQTPLHYAAFNGDLNLALLLIAEGAAVNATDDYQLTPLHLATYASHNDLVKILKVVAKVKSTISYQISTKPPLSAIDHRTPRHGV